MGLALIDELNTVAAEIKRSSIEDLVDASWTTVAVSKELHKRRLGTLLMEVGVKRRERR